MTIALACLVAIAAGADPAATHSPEFEHAVDLYRAGEYEEAATIFLKIAAQQPHRPEAAEAQRLATQAARRAPDVARPPSDAGRIELAIYNGLAGGALGVGITAAVFQNYYGGPALPVATMVVLSTAGAAGGAALGFTLTKPGFPPHRPQLAATLAVGTGFVLVTAALTLSGGRFDPASTIALLAGPPFGYAAGLMLSDGVAVHPGRLAMVNSAAFYGCLLGLFAARAFTDLPAASIPAIALVSATIGAGIMAPISLLVEPTRFEILTVDVAMLVGGLVGGMTIAFEPSTTATAKERTGSIRAASGMALGFSAAMAYHLLVGSRPSPVPLPAVSLAPWTDGRRAGIAWALAF